MNSTTLNSLRAAVERYMTETCVIEAQQPALGKYREERAVWQVVYADLKCRVITVGNRTNNELVLVSERKSIREQYKLIVPYDTALSLNQRVTVNGQTYTIINILTERTDAVDAQAFMERVA
jgi:hypothetical protein